MTSIALSTYGLASSEAIRDYEAQLKALKQHDTDIDHEVFGGISCRTAHIPGGMSFVGQVHKHDHINIVVGDITIVTDDGTVRLTGYNVLPTKAGSKRVAYTHAPTTWTTIHATDLTDVQAIEDWAVEDSSQLTTRLPQITKD